MRPPMRHKLQLERSYIIFLFICFLYFLKFTLNCRINALQVYVGFCCMSGASLIAQLVNHLPAIQETWVQFLGWEDPLEKEMATQSSILAWRIPWTEEPDRLQSMGSQT